MMGEEIIFASSDSSSEIKKLIEQLDCVDEIRVIINSLTFMNIAFSQRFPTDLVSIALDKLSLLLNQSDAMAHATTWAMGWLAKNSYNEQAIEWAKNEANIQVILTCLRQRNFDTEATQWLISFVGQVKEIRAVEPLIAKLDDEDKDVRRAACNALGEIKDVRAVELLIAKLDDEDKGVRQQALRALAKITRDETDQKLLSEYFEARYFWLDPKEPIAHARIAEAAEALNLPPEEIQRRYEALAQQFGLILEWKQ